MFKTKKIEITINANIKSDFYFVDIKNNQLLTKTKKYPITNEEIAELLLIVKDWKDNYTKTNIIDSEEFILKIDNNVLHGKGDYPPNYDAFKKWLGDFCD